MDNSKVFTGKVVFFSTKLGYGFISPDSGEKDLFVHFKNILGDGFKTLRADQIVEFELGENDKGPMAVNVRVTKEAPVKE